MNRKEQQRFAAPIEERLAEIRAELSSVVEAREAVSPDKVIGRFSRLDSMQMQQMALAGKRRLEQEARDLDEVLRRIEAGQYGRCALRGNVVARERLEYQPAAPVADLSWPRRPWRSPYAHTEGGYLRQIHSP